MRSSSLIGDFVMPLGLIVFSSFFGVLQ